MTNLLKRQGILNTIVLYTGTAFGFFNLIILFQRYLTLDQIGFFSLITAISLLYAQVSGMGITNIIIRFSPYYRTDDKRNNGFTTFTLLWAIIGFVIVTVFFLLFRNVV